MDLARVAFQTLLAFLNSFGCGYFLFAYQSYINPANPHDRKRQIFLIMAGISGITGLWLWLSMIV